MWIAPIRLEEAQEPAKSILEGVRSKSGAVPKFLLTLARRPNVLAGRQALNGAVHGGNSTLGRRREELLSYYLATLGGCYGWTVNHSQAFRAESGEPSQADVAGVIKDPDRSPILDEADKAMLAFAEKLTFDHVDVHPADLDALRDAGFSEDNIVDIIASTAYRNFSNRLNLALGLDDYIPEGPPEIMELIRLQREARA